MAALHCRPRAVFVTDIHEPTIANSLHNARLNQALDPHSKADSGSSPTDIVFKHSSSATEHDAGVSGDLCVSTAVRVLNVNWKDFGSFPAERADVLLGSDLVYDSSILAILVPAVDRMMTQGEQPAADYFHLNTSDESVCCGQMAVCCTWRLTRVATACRS